MKSHNGRMLAIEFSCNFGHVWAIFGNSMKNIVCQPGLNIIKLETEQNYDDLF